MVMAPWLVFNVTRFEQPELLSTQFGLTLSSANCDQVWNGEHVSYFDIRCSQRIEPALPPGLDESQQDARHREIAIELRRRTTWTTVPAESCSLASARSSGSTNRSTRSRSTGSSRDGACAAARVGMYSFYVLGAAVGRRRDRAPPAPHRAGVPAAGPAGDGARHGRHHLREHAIPRVGRGVALSARGGRDRRARGAHRARPTRGEPAEPQGTAI